MLLNIPQFCLILLIGPEGAGKSAFAKAHFQPSEIVSLAECHYQVTDQKIDSSASPLAFELLYHLTHLRLFNGKLTVIDAQNLNAKEREKLRIIAKKNHCQVVAMVFDPAILLPKQEKYLHCYSLPNHFTQTEVIRHKLDIDKSDESGPFDIIGDVHGCYAELLELLTQLGYQINEALIHSEQSAVIAPLQRRAVFVGDLTDRGPQSLAVLALVMNMVKHGSALCIAGNHEIKLLAYLKGKSIQLKHGLETTVQEFEHASEAFKSAAIDFIESLPIYYVFDNHRLVVAHAGMKAFYQGRISPRIKSFSLYGATTGEIDEFGYPIRSDWAQEYHGEALVVYGHAFTAELHWVNNTLCIDTGCAFGGKLTALRYPEKETISISAKEIYYPSTYI
ncbi:metallophosphoesterase [Candidatus Berkiella aquae]|uniref:Bis(5'-nucleosyl)-tetraphosphatase PrpE [asymmetrical] n=1 Tax=Candidatus Berkiella aquae TaxID=295108 RepID=A0A0Q9YXP9_9GAMM|nr:metallophosphoesterase [Candidatus Berkiella aquae]MCS5710543.1 metallophosphoesterase [Candidatus Berkiella aquae]